MALYEYRWEHNGKVGYEERRFPMGEAPEQILVSLGNGFGVMARRVISVPGLKKDDLASWATDLPPENSPVIE